jgi:hypothetical protein
MFINGLNVSLQANFLAPSPLEKILAALTTLHASILASG